MRSSRLLRLFAALALSASSSLFATVPAHAVTVDSGVCTVHAELLLGPPALATGVQLDYPYAFFSNSASCTSAFGSQIDWDGSGFAQQASCGDFMNLLGVSTFTASGNQFLGVTTSGAGTLQAQVWAFQSLDTTFTGAGTFVPDTSVYSNPAVPEQQCIGGGLSALYLTGVVTYELRTLLPT